MCHFCARKMLYSHALIKHHSPFCGVFSSILPWEECHALSDLVMVTLVTPLTQHCFAFGVECKSVVLKVSGNPSLLALA